LRSFYKRSLALKVSGLSTRLTAVLELDRTELGDYSRQVALFKRHLMQSDPETGNRILSDATVNRTLGTLKISMVGCSVRNMSADPTTEVDRPN